MSRFNILIIEDNKEHIKIIKNTIDELKSPNIKIFSCKNGKQAFRLLKNRFDFDLILLDIKLSDINGFNLAKYICNEPLLSNAYLVILSSSISIKDIGEAKSIGVDAYITKPVHCLPDNFKIFQDIIKDIKKGKLKKKGDSKNMNYNISKKKEEYYKKILWVEDDEFFTDEYILPFKKNGLDIIVVDNVDDANNKLNANSSEFDLIILDVRLKPGKIFSGRESRGGYMTGVLLAAKIIKEFPNIPIVGFSISDDKSIIRWFNNNTHGYFLKNIKMFPPEKFFKCVEKIIINKKGLQRLPKIFIVHGHDENEKLILKNFIQNTLKLGEPIILHEKPNLGRTLIEKFEEESENVDIVFVLLTPDDPAGNPSMSDDDKRRARPNVIFELGYFFGKLGRRAGKVILCYKGNIELPSDLYGIVYINISKGIDANGEEIRRELSEWL